MLTFEEWRHTYADVFETDDAARAAWTAASNNGYRAGEQDTQALLTAHSAGAREPVAWRHKWTNDHAAEWAYKEAGPKTDELRIGIPGVLGPDSHRECWEPLYAHPQPMTDAARKLSEAAKNVLANGHQHDVGGGDVFLGTCDSTEQLQRALAEIERLDRAKDE